MKCSDAKTLIHLYLDGELPDQDTLYLKQHLVECGACKVLYKQEEEAEAMLKLNIRTPLNRQSRNEADIDMLTNKILQAIPMKATNKSHKRFVKWLYKYPALTAVAVFAVIMVASLVASYGQNSNVIISASENDLHQIQIQGNTVTVPEGAYLTGNIVVENGTLDIKGEIDGNVTVIDGQLLLASTGHIAGHSKTIDQALDWLWYKITSSITNLVPEWNTSTIVSLL